MRDRRIDRQFERFRRTGDVRALAAVFDATVAELHRVALYLTGDRELADDAVQETFVAAIEDAGAHDGARRVVPWLLGILANRARNLRRRRARAVDPERAAPGSVPSAADEAAGRELEAALDAGLDRLESPYREVVVLHVRHGMTARQIGEALGRPAGTVRTQVVRGLDRLRRLLPAGFAASTLMTVAQAAGGVAPRVRAAVLARAAELAPAEMAAAGAAAAATGVLAFASWIGGMVMTKWVAGGMVVAGLVAGLWGTGAFDRQPGGPLPPARPDATPRVATPAAEAQPAAAPTPRVEVETAAPDGPDGPASAVRLEFVWAEDDAPATHLGFTVQRRDLGSLGAFANHADWRTGDAGHVAADGLPAGEYLLVWRGSMQAFDLQPGQTLERRFELEPPLRIDGRVVDPAGDAVGGAEVWLASFSDLERGAPVRVATSDPDGRFAIRSDWGGTVWAEAEGRVASDLSDAVERRSTVELQLGSAGRALDGVVVDAAGRPVPGAEVMVAARGAGAYAAIERPAPLSLVADLEGRFATDRLGAGDHVVVARAVGQPVGHAIVLADPARAVVEVVLPRPAVVEGTVRQGGAPTSATLIAQPGWLESVPLVQNWFVARAEAGDDGRYTMDLLAPGPTRLMCIVDGAPPIEQDLTLESDRVTRWDPAVAPEVLVTGEVVDAAGQPLGGWHVWARSERRSTRTESLDDGTFRIATPVDAGPIRIWARPADAGGDGWTDEREVAPGAQGVAVVARLTPDGAGRLVGRVVDRDGAPEHEAELTATVVRHGVRGQGLQQRVGSFSIPMAPGRYAVSVRFPDGIGADLGTHVLEAGAAVDLGTIRPPELGRFVVRLRGPDGGLHQPTSLSVAGYGGHTSEFELLEDGARRTPPLGAGRFTIWARGESFAPTFQNFELAPGADTVADLRVEAATPVRFVVARPDGYGEDWSATATWQVLDAAGRSVPVGSPLALSGADTAVRTMGFAPGRYEYEMSFDGQRAVGSFEVPSPAGGEPVVVRISVAR